MPETATAKRRPFSERVRAALSAWRGEAVMPAPATTARATAVRMYAGARQSRLTPGFGSSGNSSADAELSTSLTQLRARSRQMVRDSAYAKNAQRIVVNNVIGVGVGMQAQVVTTRGDLSQRVNDDIEQAWSKQWSRSSRCHTGGALHFCDMERMLLGEVFEAGEVFVRLHWSRFGDSVVPLALEVIEAERLPDNILEPGAATPDAEVRMGIEVDRFGRPLAYWFRERHPGDIRGRIGQGSERFERVPASDVFHLRIINRWPQTRGEPWLHAVLRKLDDANEYSGAEVQAARAQAYHFATVETPADDGNPLATANEGDDKPLIDIEPLTVQALDPGEKLTFHSPNRPNNALDPFMRYMLREIAAGAGVSYESLSRDYSQSNYSSSRLALLDDRDLWRVLQQWWIRNFREPLHRRWLQQAVLAGALPSIPVEQYTAAPAKFEPVLFKPRGWSWVDPTKEVAAFKEAVKAGFTTVTDVIASTGGGQDIEDIVRTRRRELDMLDDARIAVDTDVEAERAARSKPPPTAAPPPSGSASDDDEPEANDPPPRRVASFWRARSDG